MNGPVTQQSPVSTGTSVLGICYKDGVIIAADDLASYGNMARFMDVARVVKINDTTAAGCGGDFADFQHVSKLIEQKQIDEEADDDGFSLTPKALHSWLTRVQYNRRSKFDPFWNTWIVGGIQDGNPYLGYVDLLGLAFEDKAVASGYGAYFARPMLDEAANKSDLTEAEAKEVIKRCMTVLFARDCKAYSKYHMVTVSKQGTTIEGPEEVKPDWSSAATIVGYE
ncbi:hypothetical protein B4U80_03953 [Leptotrombidium deliense]|uniref:Proteasome subunit beta n=1 Tax=Leptotrombidium deliense TaxID=299467 RepID=A0A443SK60_9ACAR|nr:hypothetical protein B4U80_03953 [Leptotrombidium deliense]